MLKRRKYDFLETILRPVQHYATYPQCKTCLCDIPHVELVEGLPGKTTYARVLVRCHGSEELSQFDFGSVEWDPSEELRKAIRQTVWFDPMKQGETTGGLGS